MSGISGIWNRIGAAFERSDIALAERAGDEGIEAGGVRRTATRYAPIRKAVERRLQAFLREDLVSHLEIGFDEVFVLHYIELVPDAPGVATLEQFLEEFSPEARVQWVKKLLGSAVGKQVSVEQFLGLDREFTAEQLAETDPFEEKLNQSATPLYRVILHGRWQRGPLAKPPQHEAVSAIAETRETGPCVRLSIQDARSAGAGRTFEVEHFPAVLGSSTQVDAEISGYYVSARHCTLHWEGERLWLVDHSTNGTWVDGERANRGTRVPLPNGALIGFGRARGDAEHDRYPALRVQVAPAAGVSTTPVAPSSATPVAPAIARADAAVRRETPLAVLAIVDATGNAVRDVPALPFSIGRGSSQDYVVPDANQGVSREHLVLEEIHASGAVVSNRAVERNGTFAGGQALPERFAWRFDEEIVLGERWTSAPPVRMSLRRVKEPA